jgi:hypothetical protein
MSNRICRVFLLAAFAIPSGCGEIAEVGEPASSDVFDESFKAVLTDSDDLLARIDLSPRHAFEFSEVGPGQIALSEVATYGESPTGLLSKEDLPNLKPVDLFRKLAPGRPLPAKLARFLEGKSQRSATAPPKAAPKSESVSQAVSSQSQGGGQSGGSCPFELFRSVSGPLGPFCPTTGHYPWCWSYMNWAIVDGRGRRTRDALAAVCVDSGQAEFHITVRRGWVDDPPRIYYQPAGTWRQWRSTGGCSGWFNQTCDNFSIMFNIPPIPNNGGAQFGGTIKWW